MKKVVLFLLPLVLLLSSCPMVQSPSSDEGYGSLILTFATSEMAAKTILPPLDMDIAYYNVYGDGPDPATFSQDGITGSAVTENNLAVGAWMITVDAFNDADEWIGSGTEAISITAGQTTQEEVHVTPLEGTGILDISVSWPSGMLGDPGVSGTLTPAGGSAESIPFSMGTDSASYSYPSLDMGYYALTIQLSDGGVVKWGCFEAVRILKDQTTEATFTLTADDINTGDVEITIVPDMEDPITITFSGQQSQLSPGTDMTITATTSEPVDTYQWYLNGGLLSGETNASITIGSSLAEGKYRLDLGVTKGNIISSEKVVFEVIPLLVLSHKANYIFDTFAPGLDDVDSVYVTASGVFAGNISGLFISTDDGASWDGYEYGDGVPLDVRDIYVDGSTVYLANWNGGLTIFDISSNTWTTFDSASGTSLYYANRVTVADGVIYLGTYDNGLCVSVDDGLNWTTYTSADGLVHNEVSSVYVVSPNIFVASAAQPGLGGVSVSHDGGATWDIYRDDEGILGHNAYSIFAVGTTVYAGLYDHVALSTDNGASWTPHEIGHLTEAILGEGNTIYAGTLGGGLFVSKDFGTSWTVYTASDGLANNNVRDISVYDTSVYVATDGGLSVFVWE